MCHISRNCTVILKYKFNSVVLHLSLRYTFSFKNYLLEIFTWFIKHIFGTKGQKLNKVKNHCSQA